MCPQLLLLEPKDPSAWAIRDGNGRVWHYHGRSQKWMSKVVRGDPILDVGERAAGGVLRDWADLDQPLSGLRGV